MRGRESSKRFFVTVSNSDPGLPPSENLGSDFLPQGLESDRDLVKYLYREHEDMLPGKLTVQHIPSFKIVFQAYINPDKKHGRVKALTGKVLQNKARYYLGLAEILEESQEYRINSL